MLPEPPEPPSTSEFRPRLSRSRAAAEVVLCSGYPTQLLIIAVLSAFGIGPAEGQLSPTFIFALSAIDTVLLLSLVFIFLQASDDHPRDVFLRHEHLAAELLFGILLLPAIFLLVMAVQVAIRTFAPHLHNVEVSPFTSLMASPWLLAGFIVLVLVAGGVREELQRAFLLYRFEQRLGGGTLGLILTSAAFGLGHTVQGWDAAIITALMGAFWGAAYLARRSIVGTVTNHALFNVAQIALGYALLIET